VLDNRAKTSEHEMPMLPTMFKRTNSAAGNCRKRDVRFTCIGELFTVS
jgi:hypothetical protein